MSDFHLPRAALVLCLAAGCSIPNQSLRTMTIPPSGAQVTPNYYQQDSAALAAIRSGFRPDVRF